MIVWLNWAAVAFGFTAAGLWFYSTFAYVEDKSTGDFDNASVVEIRGSKIIDSMATIALQTTINRYAAGFTALATLSTAIATFLQQKPIN